MSGLTYEYILQHDSKPAHCFSAHVVGKGYVNDGKDESTRAEYLVQLARTRKQELDCIGFANGYAEPGYQDTDKGVLFANWNCFSKRVVDVLESAGYAIEWQDEWSTCGQCYKAVRTSADCYQWQPYYVECDGEIDCLDCVDWQSVLEGYEDNPRKAVFNACNPADYGYRLISGEDEYESGFHAGQDDNPKEILARLNAQGKHGIVFRIGETSQFYIRFEVWQKVQDEWHGFCTKCEFSQDVQVCLLDGVSTEDFARGFVCEDCYGSTVNDCEVSI